MARHRRRLAWLVSTRYSPRYPLTAAADMGKVIESALCPRPCHGWRRNNTSNNPLWTFLSFVSECIHLKRKLWYWNPSVLLRMLNDDPSCGSSRSLVVRPSYDPSQTLLTMTQRASQGCFSALCFGRVPLANPPYFRLWCHMDRYNMTKRPIVPAVNHPLPLFTHASDGNTPLAHSRSFRMALEPFRGLPDAQQCPLDGLNAN